MVSVIRQNVAASLMIKAGFLIAATAGFATLWMAVAADMGTTLLVIFNGLRLLGRNGRTA
jgi:Cd2+/Zn2+-exporting ATPase